MRYWKEEDVNQARKLLENAGCILEGDFFFALKKKGLVSNKYVNIDPLLTDPEKLTVIVKKMLRPFLGQFTCIVGPAIGGIPLVYIASVIANELHDPDVYRSALKTAFAAKEGECFIFDRMGFASAVRNQKVLVLEDISSTGGTTTSVCDLVAQAGGNVIGVSLIWNRGGITAQQLGVPRLISLVEEPVQTWEVSNNPPGWGKLPLVGDIGHPDYYPWYPGKRIHLLSSAA